jgi:hypothetical protein
LPVHGCAKGSESPSYTTHWDLTCREDGHTVCQHTLRVRKQLLDRASQGGAIDPLRAYQQPDVEVRTSISMAFKAARDRFRISNATAQWLLQ